MQIKTLAKKYGLGLAAVNEKFRQVAISGDRIASYMSQVNHPNELGHQLIADEIMKYFN